MVNVLAIVFVLIGSLIGALGALIIKKATVKYNLSKVWKSHILWSGLFLYSVSAVFYLFALSREQLSVIYPLVSTTYIWTTFFSVKYLHEKLNKWKLSGLIGIVIGVILIGLGS